MVLSVSHSRVWFRTTSGCTSAHTSLHSVTATVYCMLCCATAD